MQLYRFILTALILASFQLATPLRAETPDNTKTFIADELTQSIAALKEQLALLRKIEPWIEGTDKARLFLLSKSTQNVLDSIEAHGLGNSKTFHAYQHLIVSYRFSTSFFEMIRSDRSQDKIAKLVNITQKIAEKHGFDDSPYTRIIENTFRQMHKLFVELESSSVSTPLKKAFEELRPMLGNVITIATQGDRPKAFAEGKLVYHRIRELYPEMEKEEGRSRAVYPAILEIIGLNEFYGEYSQEK